METWRDESAHCPQNYKELLVPSLKEIHIKNGRNSGGIIVWHKIEYDHKIIPIKKGKTHLWLKKELLNLNKDLYLCAVYIPPSTSQYYDANLFDVLENEISYFQSLAQVLICGDFNARTGKEIDYIPIEGDDHIFSNITLYSQVVQTQRQSFDSIINASGTKLLRICKSLGVYIINGRFRGDSFGRFTFSSYLGCSVVDYSITDLDP